MNACSLKLYNVLQCILYGDTCIVTVPHILMCSCIHTHSPTYTNFADKVISGYQEYAGLGPTYLVIEVVILLISVQNNF